MPSASRQAGKRRQSLADIRVRRSSKHLPHDNCDQARNRERYQVNRHRFSRTDTSQTTVRQIATRRAIVSARTLSPSREGRGSASQTLAPLGRHVRACTANNKMVRTAARRSALHEGLSTRARPQCAGRRPISTNRNEKARSGCFRAGPTYSFDDAIMPVFCPTCQSSIAMRSRSSQQRGDTKKPAADHSAGAEPNSVDDAIMPVFCPTCQTTLSWIEKTRPSISSLGEEAAVSNGRTTLLNHHANSLRLPIPRSAVE